MFLRPAPGLPKVGLAADREAQPNCSSFTLLRTDAFSTPPATLVRKGSAHKEERGQLQTPSPQVLLLSRHRASGSANAPAHFSHTEFLAEAAARAGRKRRSPRLPEPLGVFQVTLLTQFQMRAVFICRAQGAAPRPRLRRRPRTCHPSPFQQPDPGPPRHKRAHILSQPRGHRGTQGRNAEPHQGSLLTLGCGENKPQSLSNTGTKDNKHPSHLMFPPSW